MTETEQDQRPLKVKDDDEHSTHQRRKRTLEDLREQAISTRMQVSGQMADGVLSERQARQNYRGAVGQFLHEVFTVIDRDDVELSTDYQHGVTLGTITFEPSERIVDFAQSHTKKLLPGEGVPSSVSHEVVGLRSVTQLPSPLAHTFTVNYRQGGNIESQQDVVKTDLSLQVLDNAMEQATKALGEVGVGMQLDEGEQRTKITDEMIKEAAEWRAEHAE